MTPFPFVSRARLRAAEEDAQRARDEAFAARADADDAHELYEQLAAEMRATGARYDRLYADYSRLVQQVVSLKRRGYEMAPEHKKPRAMLPEPEEVGLRRAEERELKAAEEEFIDRAAKDLVKQGFDVVAAEREARRLLAEATDAHPAGG